MFVPPEEHGVAGTPEPDGVAGDAGWDVLGGGPGTFDLESSAAGGDGQLSNDGPNCGDDAAQGGRVAGTGEAGVQHDDGREHAGGRVPVPVPEGLARMVPGPELAAVLAEVPTRLVSGFDAVEVLKAASRQANHERAVFLVALLETGLREPGSGERVVRTAHPGEFAPEEARAALAWSRTRAESTFGLALAIFDRLPMVGEAMLAGEIDEPRAKAFADWTAGLPDVMAAALCDELLPGVGGLTVGMLIDRIKRLAIALDPGWVERRYREAVKARRVVGSRTPDGTANVSGLDLPPDRAKAACDRIDALARACKNAGDRRKIDWVRADLFLGMTDGTFTEMSDEQIVAHVVANPFADDPDPAADPPSDAGDQQRPCDDDPRGGSDDGHPGGGSDNGPGNQPGPGGNMDPASPGRGPGPSGAMRCDTDAAAGNAGVGGASGSGGQGEVHAADDDAGAAVSTGAWAVSELRVTLSTLLGVDDHPGELPGFDFVPAFLAREMAARMNGAQWRFVICGDDGRALASGITTRRPCPPGRRTRRHTRRGGIVEIAVRSSDLAEFAAHAAAGEHARWAEVITDIAGQHANGRTDRDAAPAELRRRVARAGLRRWVSVRDRQCTHIACRMPAAKTDQDHARDHADGGPTNAANLESACRHDHRLQHDGGWQVTKPDPDITEWISPLSHRYTSRPPPVIVPLPAPINTHEWAGLGLRGGSELEDCGCYTGQCRCGQPTMPPHHAEATVAPTEQNSCDMADEPPF